VFSGVLAALAMDAEPDAQPNSIGRSQAVEPPRSSAAPSSRSPGRATRPRTSRDGRDGLETGLLDRPRSGMAARVTAWFARQWQKLCKWLTKTSPSKQLMVMISVGVAMILVVSILAAALGTGVGVLLAAILRSIINHWDLLSLFGGLPGNVRSSVMSHITPVAGTIGGFVGATLGARAATLWVEHKLLYHPKPYSREIRNHAVLDFSGKPYVLEKVEYTLPGSFKYGQSYCRSKGDLGQISYLIRPLVKQAEPGKPAEEEHDVDEEKRSKNPGKDSVAQKTRQQVPAASTKSKGTVSALWVVFCANAMVAVDWLSFCNGVLKKARQSQDGSLGSNGDGEVAFLLIDYPGYGVNLGKPDPAGILEASHRAVVAALAHFAECRPQVHLLGHSLGAACAAQLSVKLAAEGFTPGRLVLSAPFLSIPHVLVHWFCEYASQAKSGCGKCAGRCFITCGRWPLLCLLSVIMPHRWGNKSNVRRAVRAGWQLGIMHGLKDHMVPVVMGRELHRRASATAASAGNSPVTYIEVPSADHNDMLNVAVADYGVLMGLLRAPDHRASPPASA